MPPLRVEVPLGVDNPFRDEVYATPTPTVHVIAGRRPRPVDDYIQAHDTPICGTDHQDAADPHPRPRAGGRSAGRPLGWPREAG
jgi:hypothetical protein